MKKPGSKTSKVWPSGGGQMGQLIRETDWSQTSLGPMDTWSPALKTMVTFVLMNRFPQLLWWGPYSLIKKIRSLPTLDKKEIPAIALTGYGRDEGARAIACGFHIYKSKPVDLQSLVSLLTDLVK